MTTKFDTLNKDVNILQAKANEVISEADAMKQTLQELRDVINEIEREQLLKVMGKADMDEN